MKLRKFKDFEVIKESFSQSKEYGDLLKSKAKDESFFTDNLSEIFDLGGKVKIDYYRYLIDQNGHMVNANVDKEDKYKIDHIVSIKYFKKDEYDIKQFLKVIEDLNTINISVEEMIDRCKEEVNLGLHKVLNGKDSISYIIHFQENIDIEDVLNSYNDWINFEDEEYRKGMEELDDMYYSEGIELSKFLDTNHTQSTIDIGFMADDDLYIIAQYNRLEKKFKIFHSEVYESIEWYDENEN